LGWWPQKLQKLTPPLPRRAVGGSPVAIGIEKQVPKYYSAFAYAHLRHIRVGSKQELKERIMAGVNDVNRYPVIHTWSYKLAEAA
jgi:hypothetical protein